MKKFFLSILLFFSLLPVPAWAKVDILFFYSPHCHACIRTKQEIIPRIKDKFGDKVEIDYLSILNKDNLEQLIALNKIFGKNQALVPTMFVGDKIFIGRDVIAREIFPLLEKMLQQEQQAQRKKLVFDLKKHFQSLSLLTILSAGLLDGITPCAFTVIVFFIFLLTFYGYSRKEIISIGSAYILAVFISYLLIGLGIFNFIYALKGFYWVMKGFYCLVAGICLVLASLAFYDFFKYKTTGKTENASLQLPSNLKKMIKKIIGDKYRRKKSNIVSLFAGAFLIGIAVSFLEAVCAGRVYPPIMAMAVKIESLRLKAFMYFILYNLMFILPLVLVLAFALWGVNSERFSSFMQNRYGVIKMFMGFLFLILGIFILCVS